MNSDTNNTDINSAMSSMNDSIRHLIWVKSDFAAIRQAENTFVHQSAAAAAAAATTTTQTPCFTGFSFDAVKPATRSAVSAAFIRRRRQCRRQRH